MTEEDARGWVRGHFGAEAEERLAMLVASVVAENRVQNLIAPSTIAMIWGRHIVDSAQLISIAKLANRRIASWLDVGTGAGFPGLVVAILCDWSAVLVEPRRKRAEFLSVMVERLGVAERTIVMQSRIETVAATASIISARAVSTVGDVLARSAHCSTVDTVWVLPKGRSAKAEVEQAKLVWHGAFHVEHSVTDTDSLIVTASRVSRRCK